MQGTTAYLAEHFDGPVEGLRLKQGLLAAWLLLETAPAHHHSCQHLQASGGPMTWFPASSRHPTFALLDSTHSSRTQHIC